MIIFGVHYLKLKPLQFLIDTSIQYMVFGNEASLGRKFSICRACELFQGVKGCKTV